MENVCSTILPGFEFSEILGPDESLRYPITGRKLCFPDQPAINMETAMYPVPSGLGLDSARQLRALSSDGGSGKQ